MKIVSGGQTGVDMAALEFAHAQGIPYGGWVPKGRTNEAGLIPADFTGLVETQSEHVVERTRLNVLSSDATLVFVDGSISPGTQQTIVFAQELGKPYLLVDIRKGVESCIGRLQLWLCNTPAAILNIAGPRASEAPDLGSYVKDVLRGCLHQFVQPR